MTVVAIGATKGAPGATTTALALATVWPADRPVLVVEADPDGGVLAGRRGLAASPGLVDVAAAALKDGRPADHTQPLGTRVDAVVAPADVAQVRAVLAAAGPALWSMLGRHPTDVIVDCGRLSASSPCADAARAADVTLIVARRRIDDVVGLRSQVPALGQIGASPQLVLVDDGAYGADAVAAAAGAPLVATLPCDPRTAGALNGETARRQLPRVGLLRAARRLVGTILAGRPAPGAPDPAATAESTT